MIINISSTYLILISVLLYIYTFSYLKVSETFIIIFIIIIIIIIPHGLSIHTRCLLVDLHMPPVIPFTMSQVADNGIPTVFVSSSYYVF